MTVIILKKGCNIHEEFNIKELPKTVNVDKKDYEITIEGLWKLRRSILKRPYDFIRGRKGHYLCLFRSDEKKPLARLDSKVTPIILRNVKRSTILSKAFSEMFRGGMPSTGRILFILFVIIAVGVALAYTQGWIG